MLNRLKFYLLTCLALMFCFILPSCAGGGTQGTGIDAYIGTINGEDGMPLANVSMSLYAVSDTGAVAAEPFAETITSADGEYSFTTAGRNGAGAVRFLLTAPGATASLDVTVAGFPGAGADALVDFKVDVRSGTAATTRVVIEERTPSPAPTLAATATLPAAPTSSPTPTATKAPGAQTTPTIGPTVAGPTPTATPVAPTPTATSVPASLVSANPPLISPFMGGQVFRDVLNTGSSSELTRGIGAGGTPLQGSVSYAPIHVTFNQPVSLTVSDVQIECIMPSYGSTACPQIVGVRDVGANAYEIELDRAIPPGGCTSLIFPGNVRLSYQSLPGDVDLNGESNSDDLDFLVAALNDGSAMQPANSARFDVNRDGTVSSQDLLAIVQLLNGTNTTQPWNEKSVAACD